MPAISRRHLLAAGAALAGACAFPSSPKAQQLRQINFITPLNYLIGYAPTLNAQAGGHFAKEGLDVDDPSRQGLGGRRSTGHCRTCALRTRRPSGDGKSDRTRRTDHRVRHHLAPLAYYDLQLAKEADPQRARHGRKGYRHRRLRQRIRQHSGHDARHERAQARRCPARGDRQQSRRLGLDPAGPRRCAHRQHRNDHGAQGARRRHRCWPSNDVLPMPGQAYFTQKETVAKEPELLLKILRAEKASVIEVKHADGP